MKSDIEVLKRKMLVKYPFFGSVVTNVDYKESKDIIAAATDGKIIYYNPDFLNGLNISEQIFIFAHEVCHIAFNHILRSENKDNDLWNIATDAVINQFLKRDGLTMVQGGVDIKEAINYDVETLYEKLLQNKQSLESDKSKQDVGHDSHELWEQAVKKYKEENVNEKKDKTGLEKKQEELEKTGEKDAFKKNLEEKKKQLEGLKEEILKQSLQAGTLANGDVRSISDIGTSKPIIDWRYALREAIKYDVDWSYKNAIIEDDIIKANLEEQPIPETEIVLDTSDSINNKLLRGFLRECKNILKQSRLKVGCFDTKFYGFHEIKTLSDIDNMILEGGGGTNFEVAVNAFTRRVENKIIFTDGYASMPNTSIDVIWIVFGNKKINPKSGKVIYIDNDTLNKMCSYEVKIKKRTR
jgi:predicted metal-dependent peptidase